MNDTGLVEEMSKCETNPGIGRVNISDIPEHFKDCIKKITDQVKSDKPTPVYFGATAGLRMLNISAPNKVEDILEAVNRTFNQDGKLTLEVAKVLTGEEEGLFAWISANQLSDTLMTEDKDTVGILDMGGASAQIAFESKIKGSQSSEVRLYGINHLIESSSNLCYGSSEAYNRVQWLLAKQGKIGEKIINPCMPKGSNLILTSSSFVKGGSQVCLNGMLPPLPVGAEFQFEGSSNPEECATLIDQIQDVEECKKKFTFCAHLVTDASLDSSTILALSTYHYAATLLELEEDFRISKANFQKEANQFCELNYEDALKHKNVNKKFLNNYCFQLKFVEGTLNRIYNLGGDWRNVRFNNLVNSKSLGWSLGFMIQATNAIPAEKPVPAVMGTVVFVLLVLITSLLIVFGVFFVRKHLHKKRPMFLC